MLLLITPCNINFHFYAEDTQLYGYLTLWNAASAFEQLNNCLNEVNKLIAPNKLKLNPDKTECVFLVQSVTIQSCNNFLQSTSFLRVQQILSGYGLIQSSLSQNMFKPSSSLALNTLGILIDTGSISQSKPLSWLQMPSLEVVSTTAATYSGGLSAYNITELWCVQSIFARIVRNCFNYSHIISVHRKLTPYWISCHI